jgi:hypothetical protein
MKINSHFSIQTQRRINTNKDLVQPQYPKFRLLLCSFYQHRLHDRRWLVKRRTISMFIYYLNLNVS